MAGQVTVSLDGTCPAIAVNGRFDFYVHKEFRDAYEQVLRHGVPPRVVIDLRAAEYIDSSALGMLLVLRERLGEKTAVEIVNCHPDVKGVLEIANFNTLFKVA